MLLYRHRWSPSDQTAVGRLIYRAPLHSLGLVLRRISTLLPCVPRKPPQKSLWYETASPSSPGLRSKRYKIAPQSEASD